jgi:hypothetical protein
MKQTAKLSGSFVNYLMGNNSSTPIVGEWATICLYSDRQVAKVTEVSKDGKRVVIQNYHTRGVGENLCMGHQSWEHYPSDNFETLIYRQGEWRIENKSLHFEDKWYKAFEESGQKWSEWVDGLNIWNEDNDLNYIEGITRIKTTYRKISIMFGVCDYHYDWTF